MTTTTSPLLALLPSPWLSFLFHLCAWFPSNWLNRRHTCMPILFHFSFSKTELLSDLRLPVSAFCRSFSDFSLFWLRSTKSEILSNFAYWGSTFWKKQTITQFSSGKLYWLFSLLMPLLFLSQGSVLPFLFILVLHMFFSSHSSSLPPPLFHFLFLSSFSPPWSKSSCSPRHCMVFHLAMLCMKCLAPFKCLLPLE